MRYLAKLGRIRRTHFVIAIVVLCAAMTLARTVIMFALYESFSLSPQFGVQLPIDYPLQGSGVYFGALAVINDLAILLLMITRMHDMDWSAFLAVPIVAGIMLLGWLSPVLGALVLFGIIALLALTPGTIGPNRFGPDPRGWTSQEHFDDQVRRLKSGE